MDSSTFLGGDDESGWDLTGYAGNINSNSNSNSSFTGLDWINKVDLSRFREEITPDIQKYKKPSPVKAENSYEKKPAWSYSNMVALALKMSETGQLAVSDIYSFICEHFPYFRNAPPGWKNSVRHNLSLNKNFQKIELKHENHGRKSCLWSIRPEKMAKVDADLRKWRDKEAGEASETNDAGDEDASPSEPKSSTERGQKYVYTPRDRTQRLGDFSVKNVTDKMFQSKPTVNVSKGRPAILARPNAKRPMSSVVVDPETLPAPAKNCWKYSYGTNLLSSPSRPISPTLSSLNLDRSVKRPPSTPSKHTPINLFDMISPNPKSNSGLFSHNDNSLLACTLAAGSSPYKGPTTFPSSLSL